MRFPDVKQAYAEAVEDTLTEIAIRVLNDAKQEIRDAQHVDTGELVASATIKEEPGLRRVGFSAPQAAYIHWGTAPHWPPLKPIMEWVKRNLNVSPEGDLEIRPSEETPRRVAGDAAVLKVARAIQVKISQEGTDADPFLSRSITKNQGRIGETLAKHLKRRGL